ncbi:MAG: hypothetical protein M3076_00760 [Actinomycetota bacterium]|nr:hypothetical protein [Actinomycetota bacterium]
MAILSALERNYVSYVLIGGLAQVLRGADLVTTGVDICPSFVKNNFDRLSDAINELGVTGTEGRPVALDEQALTRAPVLEVFTSAGELKVIPSPSGVPSGYVDLRRAASREDLGQGVRPVVASVGDLAAMAAALGRERDLERLPALRRIVELEAHRHPAPERVAAPAPPRRTPAARRGQRLTP